MPVNHATFGTTHVGDIFSFTYRLPTDNDVHTVTLQRINRSGTGNCHCFENGHRYSLSDQAYIKPIESNNIDKTHTFGQLKIGDRFKAEMYDKKSGSMVVKTMIKISNRFNSMASFKTEDPIPNCLVTAFPTPKYETIYSPNTPVELISATVHGS